MPVATSAMITGMDFAPNPAPLWLAYPVKDSAEIAAGRIVGWDTGGERPTPVVAFVDEDGALNAISAPPAGTVWLGDSRAEVVESVKRRNR